MNSLIYYAYILPRLASMDKSNEGELHELPLRSEGVHEVRGVSEWNMKSLKPFLLYTPSPFGGYPLVPQSGTRGSRLVPRFPASPADRHEDCTSQLYR